MGGVASDGEGGGTAAACGKTVLRLGSGGGAGGPATGVPGNAAEGGASSGPLRPQPASARPAASARTNPIRGFVRQSNAITPISPTAP